LDRIITKLAESAVERSEMLTWLQSTLDGDLYDPDILEHASTFVVGARTVGARLAYLPVQQPLFLENLIFRPELSISEKARAMTKLAEFSISECYRRDAGEIYFLCRDESTIQFAERHHFTPLPAGLVVRRLNLAETFG
jgi:hypothetical protein